MTPTPPAKPEPALQPLLGNLAELIRQARQQAIRAVDVLQVQTCWEIGRYIVEFEQGGEARAGYGKQLLPTLAEALTTVFGKGFDATNLRHMCGFFLAFPIRAALRRELSWTHYSIAAVRWPKNRPARQSLRLKLCCRI